MKTQRVIFNPKHRQDHHLRDYRMVVYWDGPAGYWVAEIPEIPVGGDGPTPEEAISKLSVAFAVLKESYAEDKELLPAPNVNLPVTSEALQAASKVLKISRVAERAGISPQTLHTKLERQTQLKPEEATKIHSALTGLGIYLSGHCLQGKGEWMHSISHGPWKFQARQEKGLIAASGVVPGCNITAYLDKGVVHSFSGKSKPVTSLTSTKKHDA